MRISSQLVGFVLLRLWPGGREKGPTDQDIGGAKGVEVALEHMRHPVGKHPRRALRCVNVGKHFTQGQLELGG